MFLLTALLLPATATAPPPGFDVSYELSIQVDDDVCSVSGICSCTASWTGRGRLTHTQPGRETFTGAWVKQQSSCHPVFDGWAPPEGEAYHTLEFRADPHFAGGVVRGPIRGWVVHTRGSDWAPRGAGTPQHSRQAGQLWLRRAADARERTTRLSRTSTAQVHGALVTVQEIARLQP